ncbi:adenylate kinase [Patescibacteria group bacterium]|nr:adenylate kinase [Patescibacteria group bacterium]
MNITVMGPQGSGKSTQADLLAKKLNLLRISSGDIARQLINEDSEEGRKAWEYYNRGELIPDEILFARLKQYFLSPQAANGFVLDGYPRNMEQAIPFEEMLKNNGKRMDKVILINLPDEVGIQRMMSRISKENRSDDTPEAIKTRLGIYHQQTQPILDYYRRQGILSEVDGSGTIPEVAALIDKNFDDKN